MYHIFRHGSMRIYDKCTGQRQETSHLTVEISTSVTRLQSQIYKYRRDSYKISKYVDVFICFLSFNVKVRGISLYLPPRYARVACTNVKMSKIKTRVALAHTCLHTLSLREKVLKCIWQLEKLESERGTRSHHYVVTTSLWPAEMS